VDWASCQETNKSTDSHPHQWQCGSGFEGSVLDVVHNEWNAFQAVVEVWWVGVVVVVVPLERRCSRHLCAKH